MLEEVLGVGDASFRDGSSELIHEKIKSNKTFVLVSPNASMIRDLCGRAVWIEKGATQAESDPTSVPALYKESR